MPHSSFRLYIPWLEVILGSRNASKDAIYLLRFGVSFTGSIFGSEALGIPVLRQAEVHVQLCDTVANHSFTLCYTKRGPTHNLMYTVNLNIQLS